MYFPRASQVLDFYTFRKRRALLEFIQYCQVIGAAPQEGLQVMIQSMSGKE